MSETAAETPAAAAPVSEATIGDLIDEKIRAALEALKGDGSTPEPEPQDVAAEVRAELAKLEQAEDRKAARDTEKAANEARLAAIEERQKAVEKPPKEYKKVQAWMWGKDE